MLKPHLLAALAVATLSLEFAAPGAWPQDASEPAATEARPAPTAVAPAATGDTTVGTPERTGAGASYATSDERPAEKPPTPAIAPETPATPATAPAEATAVPPKVEAAPRAQDPPPASSEPSSTTTAAPTAPAPAAAAADPAADKPASPVEAAAPLPAAPPASTLSQPDTKPQPPRLAVDIGTGAFAAAYRQTILEPFAKRTGIHAEPDTEGKRAGDILLLDGATLEAKCNAGDLATLELAELLPDSATAKLRDDFIEGGLKPCGIAAVSWSSLFVFDPRKFEKRQPRAIADVFDVKRYPGKRALPADGRGLFEALLAADGVPARDIYATLAGDEGQKRAMKRLQSLGGNVVWYTRQSEAIDLVRQGKAAIALTSNAHAFIDTARNGALGLIWDGNVLDVAYFAVAKGTKQADLAKQLLAYSTEPDQLAGLARQIPYGPMRRSAVAMATHHAITGQELAPFLPTTPSNLKDAIRFDAKWWQENSARLAALLAIERMTPAASEKR